VSDTPSPIKPGYKAHGPSKEAALAVAGVAAKLRDQARKIIVNCPNGIAADEIADSRILGKGGP
jgi:hypothetical protein